MDLNNFMMVRALTLEMCGVVWKLSHVAAELAGT